MLVVLALLFTLFGGPNVSPRDVTSGGPSFMGAAPVVFDGTSGGPSLVAPFEPPAPDGGSGGPSHP